MGDDRLWRDVAYGHLLTETVYYRDDGHPDMRRRLARLFEFVSDSQLDGRVPPPPTDASQRGSEDASQQGSEDADASPLLGKRPRSD